MVLYFRFLFLFFFLPSLDKVIKSYIFMLFILYLLSQPKDIQMSLLLKAQSVELSRLGMNHFLPFK